MIREAGPAAKSLCECFKAFSTSSRWPGGVRGSGEAIGRSEAFPTSSRGSGSSPSVALLDSFSVVVERNAGSERDFITTPDTESR